MAKVLLIIPHDSFRDEEFTAVNEILKENGHTVSVGSTHHTEARGHFGLLVKPDINVEFVEPIDYDAMIFIGGRGVEEYFYDTSIQDLIRDFFAERKLVAAIGMAVEILVYAGILTGKRVTCDSLTIPKTQDAGAFYTGASVEDDGSIITGSGLNSKEEFAGEINNYLAEEERRRALYAGVAGSRNN